MKTKLYFSILMCTCLAACTQPQESGFDLANFDKSVRPQDDFYRYVNGTWLANTEIPADKSNYGSFSILYDESEENLRAIIEESANKQDKEPGSDEQKVGDFYQSYLDTIRVEELGVTPIEDELKQIANLKNKKDVLKHMAYLQKIGVQIPVAIGIDQDMKKSDTYIVYLHQSGLGLPDRDYYFQAAAKFKTIREKYKAYITRLFNLAGQTGAEAAAARIMEVEMEIAKNHWTRIENRDRDKTYNKYDMTKLSSLTPAFDWRLFLSEAGLKDGSLIVRQPSYLQEFNTIFNLVSTADWRTYLTWKVLDGAATLLSDDFVNAKFEFRGKTLSGIEVNRPRWKRAVNAVNATMGEVVGRIYVARHFKPAAKKRMESLVENLKFSFSEGLNRLEWMGEGTKKEALAKLDKFTTKIGYPNRWKDYSKLEVRPDDLAGNFRRSNLVEYEREIEKLGQPIDREEWFMTPQQVNAYYNPPMNEIVFPAAILQPPFFNMAADNAVNYGGIGAVIGHEVSHGFDDQGRKSDGNGNLREWWTEEDEKEFSKRAQVMIDQYDAYNPIDSLHVKGGLTLGENIADLAGLTLAFRAYKKSLNGKPAAVIDGFTGEQRVFIGWAQVWRRLYRDDELRRRLLTDPHSPSQYRCNGIVSNMPEFYAAFDVKEGDGLYQTEEQRVKIW